MIGKLVRLYRAVFYNIYRWHTGVHESAPVFSAVISFSGLMIINGYNLFLVISFGLGVLIIPHGVVRMSIPVFSFIVLAINYVILIPNGRFDRIRDEFEGESERERRRWKRTIIVSFLLSLAFSILGTLYLPMEIVR